MKLIKEALDFELKASNVNWETLEQKIHAALKLVDNNFKRVRVSDNTMSNIKTSDSLVFSYGTVESGKLGKRMKCVKIISPRFLNGQLWCKGIQYGFRDLNGRPFFLARPIEYE